jgi:uncharacterized membrane protein
LIARPQPLPPLAPGEAWRGSISVRVARTAPRGDYLITGEAAAPNDGNQNDNRQTVKVSVR